MFGLMRLLTVLLAAAVVLTGCASGEGSSGTTGTVELGQSGDTEGGIVLPTASGGQIAVNDLVGTPTMLWFWAPW